MSTLSPLVSWSTSTTSYPIGVSWSILGPPSASCLITLLLILPVYHLPVLMAGLLPVGGTSQQVHLVLDGRCFQWTFLLATIQCPIIGVDFIQAHHLLVDPSRNRLVDKLTLQSFKTEPAILQAVLPGISSVDKFEGGGARPVAANCTPPGFSPPSLPPPSSPPPTPSLSAAVLPSRSIFDRLRLRFFLAGSGSCSSEKVGML